MVIIVSCNPIWREESSSYGAIWMFFTYALWGCIESGHLGFTRKQMSKLGNLVQVYLYLYQVIWHPQIWLSVRTEWCTWIPECTNSHRFWNPWIIESTERVPRVFPNPEVVLRSLQKGFWGTQRPCVTSAHLRMCLTFLWATRILGAWCIQSQTTSPFN